MNKLEAARRTVSGSAGVVSIHSQAVPAGGSGPHHLSSHASLNRVSSCGISNEGRRGSGVARILDRGSPVLRELVKYRHELYTARDRLSGSPMSDRGDQCRGLGGAGHLRLRGCLEIMLLTS